MKARRDRLARALDLNDKLWRLQTLRLAQLEATLAELQDSERATLDALDRNIFDPRLLLDRLQLLAQRRHQTEEAHRAQLARVREHGRRAKQAERLFERVDGDWRREQAAVELRRLVDRTDVSAP